MTLVLANVFGMISGTLIMFCVSVILQTTLPDGLPAGGFLLSTYGCGFRKFSC